MKNNTRLIAVSVRFAPLLIALMFSVVPMPVRAISVSMVPDTQSITVGQSVKVDLIVSGLEPGITPPIGAFDIQVRFNPSILLSTTETLPGAVVFGPYLGIPGTEASLGWGVNEDQAIDVVGVFETTDLSASYLASIQPTSFRLASLNFDGLSVGTSQLEFAYFFVGGSCNLYNT